MQGSENELQNIEINFCAGMSISKYLIISGEVKRSSEFLPRHISQRDINARAPLASYSRQSSQAPFRAFIFTTTEPHPGEPPALLFKVNP